MIHSFLLNPAFTIGNLLLFLLILFFVVIVPYATIKAQKLRKIKPIKFYREFPPMKPYLVNRFFSPPYGEVNVHAFSTVVLDFLKRKIITIESMGEEYSKKETLYQLHKTDHDELDEFEYDVYLTIRAFTKFQPFTFSQLTSQKNYKTELQRILSRETVRNMNRRNSRIFRDPGGKLEAFLMLFAGLLLFVSMFSFEMRDLTYFSTYSLVCSLLSLTLLIIYRTFFKEYALIWMDDYEEMAQKVFGYKRFITSLTALKKYPPKSLPIWNEHLVYATALGCAKTVHHKFHGLSKQYSSRLNKKVLAELDTLNKAGKHIKMMTGSSK